MNISNIIAVSGVGGLNRLVSSRSNGLVVESLDTEKVKFYSVRKHQFTPLETVSIYTMTDTTELKAVFETMQSKMDTTPLPEPKAAAEELKSYFAEILPDYDLDRVYVSDIKKIIKWYQQLETHGLTTASDEEE